MNKLKSAGKILKAPPLPPGRGAVGGAKNLMKKTKFGFDDFKEGLSSITDSVSAVTEGVTAFAEGASEVLPSHGHMPPQAYAADVRAAEGEGYEQSDWQGTSAGQRGNDNESTAPGQQVPEDDTAKTDSNNVYSTNLNFENVFQESKGAETIDCWKYILKIVYIFYLKCTYNIIMFILGICTLAWWGFLFSLLSWIKIWCLVPCTSVALVFVQGCMPLILEPISMFKKVCISCI